MQEFYVGTEFAKAKEEIIIEVFVEFFTNSL